MDTAIPVRNLIEEPSVETGILAVPQWSVSGVSLGELEVSSWIVAAVLLGMLLLGTLLYYGFTVLWPGRTKRSADLLLIAAIDRDPALQPRE